MNNCLNINGLYDGKIVEFWVHSAFDASYFYWFSCSVFHPKSKVAECTRASTEAIFIFSFSLASHDGRSLPHIFLLTSVSLLIAMSFLLSLQSFHEDEIQNCARYCLLQKKRKQILRSVLSLSFLRAAFPFCYLFSFCAFLLPSGCWHSYLQPPWALHLGLFYIPFHPSQLGKWKRLLLWELNSLTL